VLHVALETNVRRAVGIECVISRHEIASHSLQVTLRYTQTVNRVRGYPRSFLRSNRCAIEDSGYTKSRCSLLELGLTPSLDSRC